VNSHLSSEQRAEVLKNLGLAFHFARKYRVELQGEDDLFQEVTIGLCEAVRAEARERVSLARVAQFEAQHAFQRFKRSRRQVIGVGHEGVTPVGIPLDAPVADTDGLSFSEIIADPAPLPDDIAAAREELSRIPTRTDTEAVVVRMRAEGEDLATIGAAIGRTNQGALHILNRVRSRCR